MGAVVDGSSCDQQAGAGWIGPPLRARGWRPSSRGMTRAVSVQCGQTGQGWPEPPARQETVGAAPGIKLRLHPRSAGPSVRISMKACGVSGADREGVLLEL